MTDRECQRVRSRMAVPIMRDLERMTESHVKGLVENWNEKIIPPAQREARTVPHDSRQRTDPVQKNTVRAAVVLVVLEDALADLRVARLHPPVKPLNGCGTRRIGVPPIEAEVFG